MALALLSLPRHSYLQPRLSQMPWHRSLSSSSPRTPATAFTTEPLVHDIRKGLKFAIKTTIDEWPPSCEIVDACVAEHTVGKREIRGVC
ncbi:hypothetical protein F751_4620 [Auxenochlorella protothecoides]|uniref:Uncharacterized protein n=1 Tax=Auxenochlorella protothecoides TaxID=3075 RepID=A0A087SNP6_AUXPR|nr:hypothetical protein F751_4620 [Auxenochlorella protothecoides]KFM27350.1 hypothetical protein F751_4620 [Auxenochlorella protothecoides]